MQKLHLHIGEKLQGAFSPQKFNLLLTFQVNCPGCFIYALPMFEKLYEQYADQMGFLALSTAFEDFDRNTTENTQLLLEKGELIGETKKALGSNQYDQSLSFPVAMDAQMKSEEQEMVIENICHLNPNFTIWADYDKDLMRKRVKEYLSHQQQTSMTFTSNQFKGTPTLALFNDQYEMLSSWFGHIGMEAIQSKIESVIGSKTVI